MVINHLLTGMILQAGTKSIPDRGKQDIIDPKEGYDVSLEQEMIPIFLPTFTFFFSRFWVAKTTQILDVLGVFIQDCKCLISQNHQMILCG